MFAIATALIVTSTFSNADVQTPPWMNPMLPFDERVELLTARMTQAQLAQQLLGPTIPSITVDGVEVPGMDYGQECLSGFDPNTNGVNSTAFPSQMNMGATFDTILIKQVANAISDEVRAFRNSKMANLTTDPGVGILCLSPVLNMAHDPRWGRSYETYSEDPHVIATLGTSYARGLQFGMAAEPTSKFYKVVSVGKHLGAYSVEGCQGNDRYPNCSVYRSLYNSNVDDIDLQESYFHGWRRTVIDGNLTSAMCSYNAINGVPSCANSKLLTKIFRGDWGADGLVVSDAEAIPKVFNSYDGGHRFAHSNDDAARRSLLAGCDVEFSEGTNAYNALTQPEAIMFGITLSSLRQAAGRSLRPRFMSGMLDPAATVPWNKINPRLLDSPQHRVMARQVALESFVLLKNTVAALPFLPRIKRIAVVGKASNSSRYTVTRYTGRPTYAVSIIDGITTRGLQDHVFVTNDTSAIVDVTVIAVTGEGEGESHDRFNLTIAQDQKDLIKNVTGPIILVLVNGGALALDEELLNPNIHAIVETFQGGEEAGTALASLLWGDDNFCGALPVTAYSQTFADSQPYLDMGMRDGYGRGYRYLKQQDFVQFPFGFGLSYTQWVHTLRSMPVTSISTTDLLNGKQVSVVITVSNVGAADGRRPVIMFLRCLDVTMCEKAGTDYGVVWPTKWVVAFAKTKMIKSTATANQVLSFGLHQVERWSPVQDKLVIPACCYAVSTQTSPAPISTFCVTE